MKCSYNALIQQSQLYVCVSWCRNVSTICHCPTLAGLKEDTQIKRHVATFHFTLTDLYLDISCLEQTIWLQSVDYILWFV